MEKSTKEPNKPANDSEKKEDPSVGNGEKKDTGRRLQDSAIVKDSNRKLNLERRVPSDERRIDADPHYKGPVRRYNIDSRVKLKDRRDKE